MVAELINPRNILSTINKDQLVLEWFLAFLICSSDTKELQLGRKLMGAFWSTLLFRTLLVVSLWVLFFIRKIPLVLVILTVCFVYLRLAKRQKKFVLEILDSKFNADFDAGLWKGLTLYQLAEKISRPRQTSLTDYLSLYDTVLQNLVCLGLVLAFFILNLGLYNSVVFLALSIVTAKFFCFLYLLARNVYFKGVSVK